MYFHFLKEFLGVCVCVLACKLLSDFFSPCHILVLGLQMCTTAPDFFQEMDLMLSGLNGKYFYLLSYLVINLTALFGY